MVFVAWVLTTLLRQTTLSQKCKFSILFLFLMFEVKFWIYFGHFWLPVNDWIFYARASYISQSQRKRTLLTPHRRQPAVNNMRELNFRAHLPQHYFCLRILLLGLSPSDQKKNDAWNPLLRCSSSFRVTRRKPHNAKMRIAYQIFAGDVCMDTATRDDWGFFLLSVST